MKTQNKPKAILIDVIDPQTSKYEAMKRLEELESLVKTYGGLVIIKIIQKKGIPNYKTYVGSGKLQEAKELALEEDVKLIIINNILKPGQIYNIQKVFKDETVVVWDRVDLILKIFEKHAQSAEAKLQVELASIRHMGPRIYGMGEELSRQGGAVGMRAGGGESNIELMKRHLSKQELKVKEKLEHYGLVRKGHRSRRIRNNFKTAAIIGYTNSGKSSLLNALTKKGAYVADELFATLDTRVGKLYIPNSERGTEVLLSDTIGFIRDLPPSLIEAFKSTLSETMEADILLHVIDVSDPAIEHKIQVVEEIVDNMGMGDKPKIYIFNKIDLIDHKELLDINIQNSLVENTESVHEASKEALLHLGWHEAEKEMIIDPEKLKEDYQQFTPVFVSAAEKLNLDDMVQIISHRLENIF